MTSPGEETRPLASQPLPRCARARAASKVAYLTVFDIQARRPGTVSGRWLAPRATAATARARPRARASCSSAPSVSPTSCRAAERRVVRGVQSEGRGLGGLGRGTPITRARVLPGSATGGQELVMSAMVPHRNCVSPELLLSPSVNSRARGRRVSYRITYRHHYSFTKLPQVYTSTAI